MQRLHWLSWVSLTTAVAMGCSQPPRPVEDASRNDGDSAMDVADAADSSSANEASTDAPDADVTAPDATETDGSTTPVDRDFCASGAAVPGLTVPDGFCVRKYSNVRVARVMALAPNGDLFVAAPLRANATGLSGGPGAIVVLHDDERDGRIEETVFASNLPDVHGLVFSNGYLYWTNDRLVERTPYTPGLRVENAAMRERVIGGPVPDGMGGMIEDPNSTRLAGGGRQTHGLSRSVNGTIYVTRGEYSSCTVGPGGVRGVGTGEVYSLGMHSLTRAIYGFRNPMYTRCHFSRELCMVAELGEDNTTGATEKLLVIPSTAEWYGYPCCHQRNVGPQASTGNCADVREQEVSINLGDTPFGFDWERGRWPAPYRNGVFVALHGSFYTGNFAGAGVVYLPTDPATGVPMRGAPVRFISATNGQPTPSLQRPSDVVFAPDGRMFISDDYGGGIYMVAPRFTM